MLMCNSWYNYEHRLTNERAQLDGKGRLIKQLIFLSADKLPYYTYASSTIDRRLTFLV